MATLDATHDPALVSWVESANDTHSDFPIQNLPHGVFRRKGSTEPFRGGVAIGSMILDMAAAAQLGVFSEGATQAARAAGDKELNGLMALGHAAWSALRADLSRLLRQGAPEATSLAWCLSPHVDAEYALPAQIGDYSDFFTSYYHMVNAGRVFNPNAPALPNFKWLPIAYHGRASSIEVSGATFARPNGQTMTPGQDKPQFGPCKKLDYECELGFFIGPGNARGQAISAQDAERHIFGMCLLNDWSARDVQAWESTPLGPFLAKSFLTTISPWVVTLQALSPFRCKLPRSEGDPPNLQNLLMLDPEPGVDIQLEVWLETQASTGRPMLLSRTSSRHCYWSIAQMLAHHTEGGCNMRPGDLLGTGTQSGPEDGEQGCLLELTNGGRQPLELPNGEGRGFLEDGDCIALRAHCEREGFRTIGFGECRGTVLPGP